MEYLKDDTDFKGTLKATWVAKSSAALEVICHEFGHLITKEKLEEDDNFADFINKNSQAKSVMIAEPALRSVQQGTVIQIERRGYFRIDESCASKDGVMNMFLIPDGKQKAMSTLSTKLDHA